ncbi:hypothetical protein GW915_12255 [bacterium]|nr:hypothetical protein [bacterium]
MGSYSRTAYLALKKETTENTAVTPDVFVPFLSESIAAELANSFSKSIVGSRSLNYDIIKHAIPAPAGEITLNVEPQEFGHFLRGLAGAISTGNYFPITSLSADFTVGETVTGGTSLKTAVVVGTSTEGDYVLVNTMSGAFTDGETITGGTSGSTATLTKADALIYGHEVTLPQTSLDFTYTVEVGYDNEVVRYTGVRFHSMAFNQTENIITAKISVSARAQFRGARVTEAETSGAGAHTVLLDQTTGLAASDTIKVYRRGTGFLDFSAASVKTHTVASVPDETSITFTNLETSLAVDDIIVLAPQTDTYTVEKEFTWAGGSVLRLGTTITAALTTAADYIEDFELNIVNNIEPRHAANGINHVDRYPAKVFTAGFDVTGKIMRTYTDVTYLDKLRGLEKFALHLLSTGEAITVAADFSYLLDIRVADCRHLPFQPSIAEDDLLNQDMDFAVLPSLDDGYTVKILLVNDSDSY